MTTNVSLPLGDVDSNEQSTSSLPDVDTFVPRATGVEDLDSSPIEFLLVGHAEVDSSDNSVKVSQSLSEGESIEPHTSSSRFS